MKGQAAGAEPGNALLQWARGWWPDRNPLRRSCDRVEALILAGLLALFLAGAPVVALVAGSLAYNAASHMQRAQEAARHLVPAVLLAAAPDANYSGYAALDGPPVRATWKAPDGRQRTGEILAPAGAKPGSKVMIWVNNTGGLAEAPLRPAQVSGQQTLAEILAPAALALLLMTAASITRRLADNRRMAAWDEDWRVTEPQWTHR